MIEKHILIVDNNKAFLRLYEHNFTQFAPNSQVFTACNGVEALHQLDVHPCDLIIADSDSPGMNSLDFAQAVYQRRTEAHILFMSIQDAEKVEAKARNRHVPIDGCLSKSELLIQLWECESRKVFK
ncbi:MAG: response regulator [Chloroflexi bacterium]|nr:response regulator [Chloroflexota bacterium]